MTPGDGLPGKGWVAGCMSKHQAYTLCICLLLTPLLTFDFALATRAPTMGTTCQTFPGGCEADLQQHINHCVVDMLRLSHTKNLCR